MAVRGDLDPIAERIEGRVKIIEMALGGFLLRVAPRFLRAFAGCAGLPLGLRAPLLLGFQSGLPLLQALLIRAPLRQLGRVLLDRRLLGGELLLFRFESRLLLGEALALERVLGGIGIRLALRRALFEIAQFCQPLVLRLPLIVGAAGGIRIAGREEGCEESKKEEARFHRSFCPATHRARDRLAHAVVNSSANRNYLSGGAA